MAMPNQVPKLPAQAAPVAEHGSQLPDLGREPGIVAFAVLKNGKEYVPTKIFLEDAKIVETVPCGPRGIYEPTAYEYLMAAVMDHYRLKALNKP